MENRINISELLKDCPKGMELDCTMFENLYFDYILKPEDLILCYTEYDNIRTSVTFNRYGAYSGIRQAKCVIFPKGKDTWEGFRRPFKDGDIVATENGLFIGIIKVTNNIQVNTYCAINISGSLSMNTKYYFDRFATEEERQKLFQAIKDNGYRWNAETKKLEKLVAPNFKVGNKIIRKGRKGIDYPIEVLAIENGMYKLPAMSMPIDSQDEWELFPDKFDISTLKPFDKVLVRDNDKQTWCISFFSHCNGLETYKYSCINGSGYSQCIPYEGNEHLIGVINECSDFYKTWEK